jgi:outer membrane protein assembly factor BamB
VAGEFRVFEGRVGYQRLALVRPGNGNLVETFDPRNRRIVHDIHSAGGRLYVAEGGPNGGGVMALDDSTGENLWERRLDGDAEAVTVIGSDVYAGGHFDNVCDDDSQVSDGDCTAGQTARLRGASFDVAGELTGWDPQGNTEIGVRSFDVHSGSLLVGGGFTAPTKRFALFR